MITEKDIEEICHKAVANPSVRTTLASIGSSAVTRPHAQGVSAGLERALELSLTLALSELVNRLNQLD